MLDTPHLEKKEKEELPLICCINTNLLISLLRMLPVFKEHGEKDTFKIVQYGAEFWRSVMGIRVLKIKQVEDAHLQ